MAKLKIKSLFSIFFVIILLAITSCNTLKLVQRISDAKKLEINKDEFIGRPLKDVLSQIKPNIKFVYGNPENNSGHVNGGTYLSFYFVTRQESRNNYSFCDKPTHITIRFNLETINNRNPLPADGLNEWTNKETKKYGDMIIQNIFVYGEN